MEAMLDESLKEDLKIEVRLLPSFCGISLDKGSRQLSRIDFGEVFMVKMYLKEVQKPKKGPENSLNKSNPTVKAKIYLQNVFEHYS